MHHKCNSFGDKKQNFIIEFIYQFIHDEICVTADISEILSLKRVL